MISKEEFELLISNSESSTLDFKVSMYDFANDNDLSNTAKFVKDVLCFCNTIRNESSFIIIGIEEKDGNRVLNGLVRSVDDAILQDKVKDKVFPRPNFMYYTLDYGGKKFGIIEFPVTKHSTPIHATVKRVYDSFAKERGIS